MRHIKSKRVGQVVILTPQRSLFGDDETYELREAIAQLDEEGNQYLVVNLSKVERINSTGLGFLIEGHKKYDKRGAQMKLCELREKSVHLIATVKLETKFDIYPSEEEAMVSFLENRGNPKNAPPAAVGQ
jgi:anti-sigma B factor antagonist